LTRATTLATKPEGTRKRLSAGIAVALVAGTGVVTVVAAGVGVEAKLPDGGTLTAGIAPLEPLPLHPETVAASNANAITERSPLWLLPGSP
jgi:hypothetical protein